MADWVTWVLLIVDLWLVFDIGFVVGAVWCAMVNNG